MSQAFMCPFCGQVATEAIKYSHYIHNTNFIQRKLVSEDS